VDVLPSTVTKKRGGRMQHEKSRAGEIEADPDYLRLVRSRTRFSLILTLITLAIYFGFILLIAFAPHILGRSLSGGVTTVGIPLGVGVIVAAFVLTGIYVRRANSEFDTLTQQLLERHK
jgi:uncharacterized membrane protein (DUF485 family)